METTNVDTSGFEQSPKNHSNSFSHIKLSAKISAEVSAEITKEKSAEFAEILTPEALQFLERLHRKFGKTREKLLERRKDIQSRIDDGIFPDFLPETQEIRKSDWSVASIPQDLLDRRVEITGPVDRKMVINALNSGAQVYMADFEDSHSPTWKNTIEGQINLRDAIRRTIHFKNPDGKLYNLHEKTSTLVVRPRGWHLVEKHVQIDGESISASLFDFGLFFFHNATSLIQKGSGPYFYLPKMESHLEARLWNDVFVFAQRELGIPQGTVRATVLIETLLAAFEMDEILFELREHSAGLNCGRWDYIFSFIKKLRKHSQFVLPDRAQVTMNTHFLKSYCQLLVQTCHRRNIHAMGGMAAQIPIKNNLAENEKAMEKVRLDKTREVGLGHDGTWVAHPALVEVAREVFDKQMKNPNQISVQHPEWNITAQDLMTVPSGEITPAGIQTNINVSLLYLESWLRGSGCVPLYNLMEDAATAEISRAQIWQWIRHGKMNVNDFKNIVSQELKQMRGSLGEEKFSSGKFQLASQILTEIVAQDEFVDFLTQPAYFYL